MVHYLPVKYVLKAHSRYALYCSVALCTHCVLYSRHIRLEKRRKSRNRSDSFHQWEGVTFTFGVKINVLYYKTKTQSKTLR